MFSTARWQVWIMVNREGLMHITDSLKRVLNHPSKLPTRLT